MNTWDADPYCNSIIRKYHPRRYSTVWMAPPHLTNTLPFGPNFSPGLHCFSTGTKMILRLYSTPFLHLFYINDLFQVHWRNYTFSVLCQHLPSVQTLAAFLSIHCDSPSPWAMYYNSLRFVSNFTASLSFDIISTYTLLNETNFLLLITCKIARARCLRGDDVSFYFLASWVSHYCL